MEKLSHLLIVGAGGVAKVAAHKCAWMAEVFPKISLASRRLEKCEELAQEVEGRTGRWLEVHQLDADSVEDTVALLQKIRPDALLNLALPYQDLALMEACLQVGVHYLDTANYEPPEEAKFEYSWQWAFQERFEQAGLCAILGVGFDPGVTNLFTAWAAKHKLERLDTLDIIDVNAGSHGKPFATNFNPEINIREVTAPARHWENGQFVETPAMSHHQPFTCPEGVGEAEIYRMYHEELESLTKHFPSLQRATFWMSFSPNYLKHLEVLQNLGLTSIEPVRYEGKDIVPLKFLKALLPDPGSLGADTQGQTCIGCVLTGQRAGQPVAGYIYNICDHQACYREVGSQAISYTTGVPAAVGAKQLFDGTWRRPGVWNVEQFDPDPFLADLAQQGLPWQWVDLTLEQAQALQVL